MADRTNTIRRAKLKEERPQDPEEARFITLLQGLTAAQLVEFARWAEEYARQNRPTSR